MRYEEVVKKFPHIKESDIKPEFDPDYGVCGLGYKLDLNNYHDWETDYLITAGYSFFEMPKDLQEGVLAHELGHYCHAAKHQNFMRFVRHRRWINESKERLTNKMPESKGTHRDTRMKRWYLLSEMHADNKAFEAGYGKQLLDALKFLRSTSLVKEYVDKRIENLELRLHD
ncbi:hypothetical protein FJZ53_01415 [Candidatus Woesearchaeota archaeon]|nr:hypothetical protein [Candidatus Woesearchaeota archaeon]